MNFKNLPKKYRPIPFWSWNEKMNTEETKWQIEKMDEQGIGGFLCMQEVACRPSIWAKNGALQKCRLSKQKSVCFV